MKKLLAKTTKALALILMLFPFTGLDAQPKIADSFTLTVKNMQQTANNKFEFDVYLLDTDNAQPFILASMQFGFKLNSSIYAGGTLTVTDDDINSGLLKANQCSAKDGIRNLTGGQTQIMLLFDAPLSAAAATTISQDTPGTLVTHFIFTNSIPFVANTTPNLVFNSSAAISPDYATRVQEFISDLSQPLYVNEGTTNAIVIGNPVLNATTATDYFRSKTSGNWSDASTWESSANNSFWIAATAAPTSSAASINILNGHLVTVAANATASTLNVNAGGKLTLSSGFTLSTTNFNINSDVTNGTGTFVDMNATSATGALTVTGSTNVNQYLPTGRNWYISSPVNIAPTSIVTGTAGNSLWNYTEANTGTAIWNPITTGDFVVTTGYVANVTSSGNINFTGGTLNTGAITTGVNSVPALTRSGTLSPGFNLVGNPYPSYLNWISVVAATNTGTTNMESTMWYRTKNPSATYVFDTFIADGLGGGVGTTNFSAGTTAVTGLIPPMQAFWVRVAPSQTSGTLAFDNTMRSHQDVTTNRLKAPAEANSTQQLLRLQVSNGTNSDEAVVYFNKNAADGFDHFDAEKMSNNNDAIPEIYTLAGTERVVINGLKSVYPNEELTLGFNTKKESQFTIKATELSNFDNTYVILKDKLLNTEQELKLNAAYTFSSTITNTTDRFSIVFKAAGVKTDLNNNSLNGNESVLIYKNHNGLITVNRTDATGEGVVTVDNALGQLLTSMSTTGSVTVVNKNFIPGVYLVKVTIGGKNTTKKVIIN